MCQNLADFCQIDLDLIKTELYDRKLGDLYERGAITSRELHSHFSTLSGRLLDFGGLMDAASQIFSPKEEMLTVLEQLKKQGVQLFLLSNTCEAHFLHVRKYFELLSFFNGFVLSYEVKARKPEEKIYQMALALTDSPIERCFYVDDIAEYVHAAIKLGLDSHHFQDRTSLVDALEKRGLKTS